jgi:NADH-quinone oxidoreductase subunit J
MTGPTPSDFGALLGAVPQTALIAPAIAPALLFVLAATAAVGVILLLPGRRETAFRAIGGVVLIAAGLIFAVQLTKLAGGMGIYFWVFSAIAVFGAIRVITHRRPVYSALYFVLTIMASAGLFVLMWAEFMAAALVLIYAGAILVTYVFVIMLASESSPQGGPTMRQQIAEYDAVSREPIMASAVGFALMGVMLFVIFDRSDAMPGPEAAAPSPVVLASDKLTMSASAEPAESGFVPVGGTQKLGDYLFKKQLINLELAGLILTVAMVGAIVIARKKDINPQAIADRAMRGETLTAPMTPIDDNPHSIPVYGTENPRQKEYPET